MLPLVANGSRCRNPQSDIMWRERLSWRSSSGLSPSEIRKPGRRGGGKTKSQRGWRSPGEYGPLNKLSKAHRDRNSIEIEIE